MNKAYIHLGSNKGDRMKHLLSAKMYIDQYVGHALLSSKTYNTSAWGKAEQPDFLNSAILVDTILSPLNLLKRLQKIESIIGKEKESFWGPRNIDIDILLYNDEVLNCDILIIPHKFLHERNFVLIPLAEIAGHLVHPVMKKTILELKVLCHDTNAVEILD